MHSIRSEEDLRGDALTPNVDALALQKIPNFGIKLVAKDNNLSIFTDWTGVVTNPGLFCKNRLF